MCDPIVETEQGELRGIRGVDYKGRNYISFLGIPYARPPVGKLRFRAPFPPEPWEGVLDATQYKDESISYNSRTGNPVGSEDCLYLNVYTPKLPSCSKCRLPVMVWIHGGAFMSGSGKDERLGPKYLMTENVVLVTINYRLGILGFLGFDDFSLRAQGNSGLKDMVMALQWVNKNISNFIGDTNNVTIFGNSAGACAVHYLILSPAAKELFHRAIIQSGSAFNSWSLCRRNPKEVAKALGYNGPENDKSIFEYLLAVPQEKFLKAQDAIDDPFTPDAVRPYGPVIELPGCNAFLTEHPLDIIKNGNYNKVPIIIGYVTREGMLTEILAKRIGQFKMPQDFQTRIPSYYKVQKKSCFSMELGRMIKEYYYGEEEPSTENIDKFYIMETDTLFLRGIYFSAKNHLSSMPVYMYRISLDTQLNSLKTRAGIKLPGTCHSDEIGYLFSNDKRCFTVQPDSLEEKYIFRMIKLWSTFALTGNPNPTEADDLINIEWKPITDEEMHCLDIGEELIFGPNEDFERMEFWDQFSEKCKMESGL